MATRYAVLTISDRSAAGTREDTSGPRAIARLRDALGAEPAVYEILTDDKPRIEEELRRLCDDEQLQLIVTSGGTGLAPRDVTPDATRAVLTREIPGIAEAIRSAGHAVTPKAMLSRAVAGQRNQTLIINLSGSPKAVDEQLNVVMPVLAHALSLIAGTVQDCAQSD